MEHFKPFGRRTAAVLTTVVIFSSILRLNNGQTISTACTSKIISTFTPCFNYLTGSSGSNGGASPTQDCCDTLKTAMADSVDCACLIVTGNVPVSIPFVRSLVLALPQQCNSGVPVQCKGSGVPLPAPGPAILSPPPRSPFPHYPPPRSPPVHSPAHPPHNQKVSKTTRTLSTVIKVNNPTSPPAPAVEPAAPPPPGPPPKPSLFIPNSTPAGIRPVVEPTPPADNSSYIISSSSSLLLYIFFLQLLNVFFY